MFTHGHLLGFFERSLWHPKGSVVATLLISKTENLGLEDMERFVSPFYEMLALSALSPGYHRWVQALQAALQDRQGARAAGRVARVRLQEHHSRGERRRDRGTAGPPVPREAGLLHLRSHPRAGRLVLPVSGATAINSGCWLAGAASDHAGNTLVEISDEARLIQVEI